LPVVVGDGHAEADGAVCDGPADAAQADDPEGGAVQVAAEQERWRPWPRFPGADPSFSLADPADGGEQQRPCQVGGGVGEDVGGVGDDHPAAVHAGMSMLWNPTAWLATIRRAGPAASSSSESTTSASVVSSAPLPAAESSRAARDIGTSLSC